MKNKKSINIEIIAIPLTKLIKYECIIKLITKYFVSIAKIRIINDIFIEKIKWQRKIIITLKRIVIIDLIK